MKLAIVIIIFIACIFTSYPAPGADIFTDCPKHAVNKFHRETMEYYAYRLKPAIEEYGCDAIDVYTAFGKTPGIVLDLAEEEPAFMGRLAETLGNMPGLAEMLHKYPRLTQALDLRLRNESSKEDFWEILDNLNKRQVQALLQGKPFIAGLTLLVPNLSPQYLAKNFNTRQLELLLILINLAALTSEHADYENMEELLPWISTNPVDALKIYKKVLEVWGDNGFAKLVGASSEAVSSVVPPLVIEELQNLNPLASQPEQFHKMQQDYINLIRDIYVLTANKHKEAWAAEYIIAFADLLPMALLGQDEKASHSIRKLLVDLVNSEIFAKILEPSGCYEENNLALLGRLLGDLTTNNQSLSTRVHGLKALADWHESGNLMPLIYQWLPYTNARNFSRSAKAYLEGAEGTQSAEILNDAGFWSVLVRLALIRSELLPEQQKLLDHLAMDLMRKNVHPATTLSFLLEINKPLFKIIQPHRFHQPYAVAEHLLLAGYPESTDLSLYEAFCKNVASGFMPEAGRAIEHRGSMAEAEILIHGETFADRHGGWTVWDMVDAVDNTVTITGALVFTVGTFGTGSPTLLAAASRIGLKQAARQAAKIASKALTRGARLIPRTARPLIIKGVKYAVKGIKMYADPVSDSKNLLGKVTNAGDNIYKGYEMAQKLYRFLIPEIAELPQELAKPVEICPGKTRQE